ncbi:MAG: hypothetical protein KGL98_03245 [Gammaproteobacteria bacterium]|nr:hypothetical protein [Gammaproteobacteria bacterium]MBU6509173.1 hypothetical protein [Gammaproteobacteria bacterium]MDE1984176.1 hypothetical protein [Gammaproteobacteria bacterium]MDE2108786.1 hypothetical protein [Gammaproteobacteria bacterium]MDE2460240.1 hypothetical protein [Gammaproteobacteria bacterium]
MKLSPARELARRYAAGDLSFEEYRAQRHDLVDAVCSGAQTLAQAGSTRPQVHSRLRSRKRRRLLLLPIAVVVVAAIAVSLAVIYGQHGSDSAVAVHEAKQSGPLLLREFLAGNAWDDASILHFVDAWKKLPARERQAARNSYTYPRVSSQLQEQIISQQAMLELAPDPKAAAQHLAHLQQMAALLGANNSG